MVSTVTCSCKERTKISNLSSTLGLNYSACVWLKAKKCYCIEYILAEINVCMYMYIYIYVHVHIH